MRDLCRAAADPLIHQDAVTFILSGHFLWAPRRDREDRSASGAQHPIITWVPDHFNLIPVYQLSVIFLNYRCGCRKRLKENRRFVSRPLLALCSARHFPDSLSQTSQIHKILMFDCVLVGLCDVPTLAAVQVESFSKCRTKTQILNYVVTHKYVFQRLLTLNSMYNEAGSDAASGFTQWCSQWLSASIYPGTDDSININANHNYSIMLF